MMKPDELNALFIQTHHLHFRRGHTRFSAFGLGEGQPRLLRRLVAEDGLSQAELARRCCLEPATVTVTLNRMEKAGLVARKPDADDLRITRVWLTQVGRETNEKLHGVFVESAEECFKGFSEGELEQMADFLRRMQVNLTPPCECAGPAGGV